MIEVKIWGKNACFTRPEHKVERVSYDILTPSAAQGILESIYWKPAFTWQVRQIIALNPVKRAGFTTNEVKRILSTSTVEKWKENPAQRYQADEDRTQRHSVILKDVAYIIRADIVLRPGAEKNYGKHFDILNRRVKRGESFRQPYLGLREYAAAFGPVEGDETPANLVGQLGGMLAQDAGTLALGRMVHHIEFIPEEKGPALFYKHVQHGDDPRLEREITNGRTLPHFFDAVLTQGGVMDVPPLPRSKS